MYTFLEKTPVISKKTTDISRGAHGRRENKCGIDGEKRSISDEHGGHVG